MKGHEHSWEILAHFKHAPISETDPIAHTAFVLLRCSCGELSGFPESNFALITPRFREALRQFTAGNDVAMLYWFKE